MGKSKNVFKTGAYLIQVDSHNFAFNGIRNGALLRQALRPGLTVYLICIDAIKNHNKNRNDQPELIPRKLHHKLVVCEK